MFGRNINLPLDIVLSSPVPDKPECPHFYGLYLQEKLMEAYDFVRNNLGRTIARDCKRYDLRANPISYPVGSYVWYCYPPLKKLKLGSPWIGPYKVIKKINDVVYEIRRDSEAKSLMIHVDKLKKCYREEESAQEEDLDLGPEEVNYTDIEVVEIPVDSPEFEDSHGLNSRDYEEVHPSTSTMESPGIEERHELNSRDYEEVHPGTSTMESPGSEEGHELNSRDYEEVQPSTFTIKSPPKAVVTRTGRHVVKPSRYRWSLEDYRRDYVTLNDIEEDVEYSAEEVIAGIPDGQPVSAQKDAPSSQMAQPMRTTRTGRVIKRIDKMNL